MFAMTLKEQAKVLQRICLLAPYDAARTAAIEAVPQDRATAEQMRLVQGALLRWAENGTGIARTEARKALAPETGDEAGVHWYTTGKS